MNLSGLQSWMSRFAADPSQSRYSTQQYLDAANEAQIQFAVDARCLTVDNQQALVANQSQYALPTDFMWEKTAELMDILTFQNTPSLVGGIKLEPISRSRIEFYATASDWTLKTGTP